MREIKFRAWDKKRKEIFQIGNLSISYSGSFLDCTKRMTNLFREERLLIPEDCEVMQYTGLKDINGEEIYEGDIIKWIDSDGKERRDAVEFRRGHFFICNYDYSIDCYPQIEVIGNIYENPELLEE